METIKIQIKNRWTGDVLFEYKKKNNTIKDTVEEAVKRGAYLGGAYLGGANLRYADLRGAYLGGADLEGADLRDTDLRGAYLGGADLRGANLRDAYLQGADLRGANLEGADLGDWGVIKDILIIGCIGSRNDYTIAYKTDKGIFIKCGCFKGTIDEFVDRVKAARSGTKHERDYLAMVDLIRIKFS